MIHLVWSLASLKSNFFSYFQVKFKLMKHKIDVKITKKSLDLKIFQPLFVVASFRIDSAFRTKKIDLLEKDLKNSLLESYDREIQEEEQNCRLN